MGFCKTLGQLYGVTRHVGCGRRVSDPLRRLLVISPHNCCERRIQGSERSLLPRSQGAQHACVRHGNPLAGQAANIDGHRMGDVEGWPAAGSNGPVGDCESRRLAAPRLVERAGRLQILLGDSRRRVPISAARVDSSLVQEKLNDRSQWRRGGAFYCASRRFSSSCKSLGPGTAEQEQAGCQPRGAGQLGPAACQNSGHRAQRAPAAVPAFIAAAGPQISDVAGETLRSVEGGTDSL